LKCVHLVQLRYVAAACLHLPRDKHPALSLPYCLFASFELKTLCSLFAVLPTYLHRLDVWILLPFLHLRALSSVDTFLLLDTHVRNLTLSLLSMCTEI
jgi:hypothetical protein